MSALAGLEPKEVFHYFEEISNIPRPSYKEEKISNYLVNFAKERNLEYYQDEVKMSLSSKRQHRLWRCCTADDSGTYGYGVRERTGQHHRFWKWRTDTGSKWRLYQCKGTTLGGDDGIAVAYALAILDSDSIAHPRIEFICTVSEEVGMEGAVALDVSHLKAKKLLNLDSENEGIMLVSCAGGCSTVCELPRNGKRAQEILFLFMWQD